MAGQKLADLDRQIAEMISMRADLARILEEWDARLSATADGETVHLLQSLPIRKNER